MSHKGAVLVFSIKTSPPNFIFFAGTGANYLRGFGGSTMSMETGKPLKENCLTNKKVLDMLS